MRGEKVEEIDRQNRRSWIDDLLQTWEKTEADNAV